MKCECYRPPRVSHRWSVCRCQWERLTLSRWATRVHGIGGREEAGLESEQERMGTATCFPDGSNFCGLPSSLYNVKLSLLLSGGGVHVPASATTVAALEATLCDL